MPPKPYDPITKPLMKRPPPAAEDAAALFGMHTVKFMYAKVVDA
jgi:hypothetical protein